MNPGWKPQTRKTLNECLSFRWGSESQIRVQYLTVASEEILFLLSGIVDICRNAFSI